LAPTILSSFYIYLYFVISLPLCNKYSDVLWHLSLYTLLLYMLSSWRMYEMHPTLSFKTGCYSCSSEPVGAPDTVWCTPDCPVHHADHWSSHVSLVDRADDRWRERRWLTGQSGAPPNSPVNYSHVAPFLFPRATSSLADDSPDSPVNYSRTTPSIPVNPGI
jgi:hypothetical protein